VLHTVATQLSPSIEDDLQRAVTELKDRSVFGGPVGIAGILLTSLAAFAQFDRAMDRIWNVHPQASQGLLKSLKSILVNRGVALLMLLGLGAVVTVAFLANITISAIESTTETVLPASNILWQLSQPVAPFLINILVLTLLYRWLPRRTVRWREALRGGLFAGIGWEIGRFVLDSYLIGNKYTSAYGVVGSFIAIQLWCYYSVSIVFLGAEYIQEFCRHCSGDETDESAGHQQIERRHAGSGGRQSVPPESERFLQAH
jgi:membrane protein